jgi:LytS/YehU family sensor histidine kinase
MEAKIKDQEMENFKMQSLLDKARLYALQSQMDPHFLFNTINAAVQLSVMESADNTSTFLEIMSRVFRYNIKQIDSEVTILQEIENIKDYYELLNVRFGDLIAFHFEIDESGLEFKMPPLIIQPIVENAYIHGLSKKEEGGNIYIKVINKLSQTEIIVEDDGLGMSYEIIEVILNAENIKTPSNEFKYKSNKESNKEPTKESPKIGMNNVINRLELFFKQKNLVQISSTEGIGTKVIISIPHNKGV